MTPPHQARKSRDTAEPKTDKGAVQRVRASGVTQPRGNRAAIERLLAKATAPVPGARRFEETLGADLSHIRALLGGPEAETVLDKLGVNAVTQDDRIAFPESSPGAELVGHELAHTMQQEALPGRAGGPLQGPSASAEAEAERAGVQAARGQQAQVGVCAPAGQPLFDLSEPVRNQHNQRGADNPSTAPAGTYAAFVDHDNQVPEIPHDHGFLDDGHGNIDKSKREAPTWSDRLELAKLVAKLELAKILRPDLVDATAACRHFLEGGGAPRTVNYQRFVENDSSGARVMASAIEDAQNAALQKHDSLIAGKPPTPGTTSFRMRTNGIAVGNGGRYPYPATENWQKAIGAHTNWLEMDVTVEVYEVSRTDPPGVAPGGGPVCTPDGDTAITYRRRFDIDLTPTLLGTWATAPYLHDGSAPSLEEAIAAHDDVSLGGADLKALADFVRGL